MLLLSTNTLILKHKSVKALFHYFCILIVGSRFDIICLLFIKHHSFVSFSRSRSLHLIIVYTRPLVHKTVLYVDNITIIINYIKLMAIKINSLQIK